MEEKCVFVRNIPNRSSNVVTYTVLQTCYVCRMIDWLNCPCVINALRLNATQVSSQCLPDVDISPCDISSYVSKFCHSCSSTCHKRCKRRENMQKLFSPSFCHTTCWALRWLQCEIAVPDYCDPKDPSRWTHTQTRMLDTHKNTWHLILENFRAAMAGSVDSTDITYCTYSQILMTTQTAWTEGHGSF